MKLKNKINFVTGENYTLSELFSGNYRIIIPDLQRDYCWGDKTHTDQKIELVSGFLHSLIEQFKSSENSILNLGLIYGYEIPQSHIQLCDGQQRLTTLYLLIGMLHKKTNGFRRYLISDFEYENDDKEPYLNYAIRESSLYFLSDLVCQFFIDKREMKVEDIRKADWYFHDYDLDPSIQSMLNALSIMEMTLADKDEEWIQTFGKWLTQQLSFMYVDMGDRRNGEETFVVINTTGEPLSATQNIKPLIINANRNEDKVSQNWEEIETWFWQHRSNGNDTAEAGFNEFLRWVTMLHAEEKELKRILSEGTYTFPIEKISFSEIYDYWEIVKRLSKKEDFLPPNYLSPSKGQNGKTKSISQIDSFKLLPLIAYCKQWNIADIEDRNLLRLYYFVENLSRIDNVGKAVNDLVGDMISISVTYKDIIELVDDSNNDKLSGTILSKEEILKLNILRNKPSEREKVEEVFWKAQEHPIWSGEILPLIEWSMENGQFCIDTFVDYMNKFNAIFEGDCKSNIDLVRRALLTRGFKDYPRIFRGNLNYSFGWEWSDWKELINDNKDAFKNFFNDLLQGKRTLENMITKYDESGDWAEFVHKEYLLSYCEQKNIQEDGCGGWYLVKRTYATRMCHSQTYHLWSYLDEKYKELDWQSMYPSWKPWLWPGGCVVIENKSDDLVFDIYFKYGDAPEWEVTFFRRNQEVEQSLKKYVDTEKWEYKDERYRIALKFEPKDRYNHPNVRQFIEKMIDKIQSQSV
ncbi:hypothetical protein IX335_000847 [Porphyromonas levii]|uniref:DUF262 domain-containing protein n=1 Tax=Porphyromonas levii TaxID=28114 RepID=UPI001BAC9D49|nr:DUF262 domain-containing protein [Porphyromonas levii]MBR8763632.1 hypothetical protein [Porphyromonas levii]